jgi:hypothetical protein
VTGPAVTGPAVLGGAVTDRTVGRRAAVGEGSVRRIGVAVVGARGAVVVVAANCRVEEPQLAASSTTAAIGSQPERHRRARRLG